MSLTARGIALQGFLLTPIAMAVQGLLGVDVPIEPAEPSAGPVIRRPAIAGAGPGTTISFSDYIKSLKKPIPALPAITIKKRRAAVLRRQEEEFLLLN